jgi:hypothetical protein
MEKTITINTNYARIALMLLAFNFILTGYAIKTIVDLPREGEVETETVEQVASNTEETTE